MFIHQIISEIIAAKYTITRSPKHPQPEYTPHKYHYEYLDNSMIVSYNGRQRSDYTIISQYSHRDNNIHHWSMGIKTHIVNIHDSNFADKIIETFEASLQKHKKDSSPHFQYPAYTC